MKKFTGFIAAAAIALAPMSSSALEALTDNALNDVTGQAGVSIAIDDVVLFQTIDYTKYTDEDGITKTSTVLYDVEDSSDAASLVISAKETLKVINGIWRADEQASNATAGELMANGWQNTSTFAAGYANKDLNLDGEFDIFVPSELKIDIGQCTTLTRAAQTKLTTIVGVDGTTGDPIYLVTGETANGTALDATVRAAATVTGVVIGLPTVEITTSADSYSIGVEEVADNNENLNSGKQFIKIEKGNSLMAILGGRLEIAPH